MIAWDHLNTLLFVCLVYHIFKVCAMKCLPWGGENYILIINESM